MQDKTIKFSGYSSGSDFTMELNLTYICENTGKKMKIFNDGTNRYNTVSIVKESDFKKFLNLMFRWCNRETMIDVVNFIRNEQDNELCIQILEKFLEFKER